MRRFNPHASSGNAVIVPGSLFRCGFVIEQIPQLGGETGTRARSALDGYTLVLC
jgi:hypothetical protein